MVDKMLGGMNSPLPEAQGGTNASTFAQARLNMQLAHLFNLQSGSYLALTSDLNKFIHFTGAGPYTLSLTAAATLGAQWQVTVRNDTSSNLTIDPNGGELIDGAATLTLEAAQAIVIQCDGTGFYTAGQTTAVAGANQALSNLTATAINADLLPATDSAINLGNATHRYLVAWVENFATGTTAGNSYQLTAYDTLATTYTAFISFIAGNAPACTFSGDITSVTQAPGDNSTKLATTAFVTAAVSTAVPNPLTLAKGGTNANLTASNGGIFYSTAGAGAILAGTATARQILQSGASTTPAWSTATYPATTTANQILYSSATNVIGEIITVNNGLLVTSAGGVPSIATAIPNGVTATTQAAADNSTKVATTAYADAIGTASVPTTRTITIAGTAAEITSSAGAQDLSANRTWTLSLPAALTFTGKTITGGAYASASATNFTFTTGTIGTAVTAVTQAALDNSTKIATTAFVNAATGGGAGANTALSNLTTTSVNQALIPATDANIQLGTDAKRWGSLRTPAVTGGTAGRVDIAAYNTSSTLYEPMFQAVPGNPPTGVIASAVIGVTQSPLDSSTKIATTAYVDAAVSAAVPNPLTLGKGGTNANLTASNGGIFYSTASAGAILSGTATARQMLQSGASTTPAWSTATYPATTTVNRILYSSSANVIGEITTANSSVLVTDGSGVPSLSTALPSGVTATTQSSGTNNTTVATTAYVDAKSGGLTWSEVTGTSQAGVINSGYILNNVSLVTLTLPSTAALGSIVAVVGKGLGGWRIAQAASVQIQFGDQVTTNGTGGHLDSSARYDCIELICTVANTTWTVRNCQGNISFT